MALFAALTIASTCWAVMSPWTAVMIGMAQVCGYRGTTVMAHRGPFVPDSRIRGNQGRSPRSQGGLHRVVCSLSTTKFPDTFQETRSGIPNQPEASPDIQSPVCLVRCQQTGNEQSARLSTIQQRSDSNCSTMVFVGMSRSGS